MRRIMVAVLAGIAFSASAVANEPYESANDSLLGGIVHERDVGLMFGYLREALTAAIEGRETPPPDEISRRAEAIGQEMKRRGAAAARAVIDVIERSVRESMREPQRPALPPSSPSQRI